MTRRYESSLPEREITPESVFFNRRSFMKKTALFGAAGAVGVAGAAAMTREEDPEDLAYLEPPISRPDVFPARRNTAYTLPEPIPKEMTPAETAGKHNNFYEFLPGRGGFVWKHTDKFEVDPWRVEVTGLCNNPMTLDLDDVFKFPHEERVYHFRCVERWAMNVPWSGFPLRALIEKADPKASAKYVKFTTYKDLKAMPGIRSQGHYPWPYQEALRLDEAMNELAMLVTGVYGKPLPKQHGAPIRLIVPWKYGYKNPKSIARIEFLSSQPKTFWEIAVPHEYGFLSNVNPYIPHPRWSQARSYWVGRFGDFFPTPLFNGYEKYVADLYPDEPRTEQRPLRPGQKAR